MFKFINGNKTYFVAGATALYALLGLALGHMESNVVVEFLLVAGGMVGFRSAVKKMETGGKK